MQITSLEEIVRLQSKGLITIPKQFREELNLSENSFVKIKKEKQKLVIEPVKIIPYKVRVYTKKDLEEFILFDKKETKKLKKSKKTK